MRKIEGWKDWIVAAFTSVVFLGYSPFASGTVGSVPAAALALFLGERHLIMFALAVVLAVVGTIASSQGERIFGRKDAGEIVIDEFVGMLVAVLWLPISLKSVAAAFLLFRIFDIWKPFPARKFESLPGGFGIMADDLVAGLYANLTFRIITWLL